MVPYFTTTARLKERVGCYGLSIETGAAGEEVGVKLYVAPGFSASQSDTWEITTGRMKGSFIDGKLLSFDLTDNDPVIAAIGGGDPSLTMKEKG
jgi:hypothetical protein